MREFSFDIEEALTKGLRPSFEMKANNGLFTEFNNLEPSQYGARPFSYPIVPWAAAQLQNIGIELDWPFPQLVRLKRFTLLLGATYIFHINESTWDIVQLDTYDFHTPANTKTIPTGNYWQYADYWDTFVLTNGSCSIWYDRFTDKLLVEDTVKFLAVEDYKGRAVFGGFNPDYSDSSAWQNYWTNQNSSIVGTSPKNLDWNWIKWTSIGRGLDVLIKADMSQLDLLKNDFGEMPLDDRSAILTIKKFRRGIIAYSYADATLLSHKHGAGLNGIFPEDEGLDLMPGIYNVGAVAGDRKNHVFVSSESELCWIGKNGYINLGYKEYIQNLTGDIIVSLNPLTKSFYIAGENKTYTLTWNKQQDQPQGFAESKQTITSCISDGSIAYSLGESVDDMDTSWSILTDEFDLNRTGDKTIGWVVFHGTEGRLGGVSGTVRARIHFKNDYRKDFGQSNWRTPNKFGACFFPITAERFKIEIKGDDFREIKLNRISGTDQLPDNRFTRGPNVNKINASSSS